MRYKMVIQVPQDSQVDQDALKDLGLKTSEGKDGETGEPCIFIRCKGKNILDMCAKAVAAITVLKSQ